MLEAWCSIADEAQTPTTTIYKYFKNKDDLYVAIISLIVDRTNSELNMQLTGQSSTRSKIRQVVRLQLEFFGSNTKIAYLVFSCVNIGYWYQHAGALQKARESCSLLSKIIRERQRKKEVRSDIDRHVITQLLYGTLRAMVVTWLYGKQSYRLSDLTEYFADAIYGEIIKSRPHHPSSAR